MAQFLFRFDRSFFWPAAGLTPETTDLQPVASDQKPAPLNPACRAEALEAKAGTFEP
jgi:hypothetical protein